MKYRLAMGFLGLLAAAAAGCGDKKTKLGKAKVIFGNDTSLQLNAALPPGATGTYQTNGRTHPLYPASTFGSKLINIYLISDLGDNGWDNKGTASYIWINPVCDTQTNEDGSIIMSNEGNCDTTKIVDYFEFARPSAEVNAELNSQEIPVSAGTYNYIRMQTCDNKISDNNIHFASLDAGLKEVTEGRTGQCVLSPVKISPPLTIGEGDTVEISLSYDLSNILIDRLHDIETNTTMTPDSSNTPTGCAITDDGLSQRCFHEITFVPSVTKA